MPKLTPEQLQYHRDRYHRIKNDPEQREKLLMRRRAEYARRVADPEYAAMRKAKQAEYYRVYLSKPGGIERKRESSRKAARKAQGHKRPTGEQRIDACEICGRIDSLHCDHDHGTGEHRGWLCNNCNAGLGMFADSPELLKAAAQYLCKLSSTS
jgi:hypothetical protein